MWFSARHNVIEQTRHYKKIGEAEESKWPVLLDKSKRQSRDRGGENRDRCQQHQSFVNLESTTKVKGGTDENPEYQQIAEGDRQKYKRRREAWRRLETLRSDDRSHTADATTSRPRMELRVIARVTSK